MKLKELKILVNIALVLLLISLFVFLNSQSGFKQTKEEILAPSRRKSSIADSSPDPESVNTAVGEAPKTSSKQRSPQ